MDGLRARSGPAEPLVTKSNGGVMFARQGRRDCVSMVLSGTASGVIGPAFLARQAGQDRVITLDIGGGPQFGLGEKAPRGTARRSPSG